MGGGSVNRFVDARTLRKVTFPQVCWERFRSGSSGVKTGMTGRSCNEVPVSPSIFFSSSLSNYW